MINDDVKPRGTLEVVHTDGDGNVLSHNLFNLVVSAGLALVTSRLLSATSAVVSHMAVGSGTVAAAPANTALGSELGRVALTEAKQVTTTVLNDAVQYVASFPATVATGPLTEAALFNAATGGSMLSRTVFDVINKGAADSITITWKVTFS